jgi:hypothetical protein
MDFDGVKIFSVTKPKERAWLSDDITQWLNDNPGLQIVDKVVLQSSDRQFHCLTYVFYYKSDQG